MQTYVCGLDMYCNISTVEKFGTNRSHLLYRILRVKMSTSMTDKLLDDMNSIPLADDDPQVIIPEEEIVDNSCHISDALGSGHSMDSIPSTFTNGSCSPNSLDPDISPDEQEEKARLIAQVLELQNTLDEVVNFVVPDLSQRVDSVKEENLKLRSENQVLSQYIENLMSASSLPCGSFVALKPRTRPEAETPRWYPVRQNNLITKQLYTGFCAGFLGSHIT
ncbi:Short coiled-coil protein like protein [Melipona quadrifasciata]|uniref:Short coiled-coil protein like protein n=1 Tax=Melipona quadrifasciata TaxID=166423 RepID=A0A0M9A7T7_9HYME|nr:Short coiled-coil protein like protein [Melipona quadrifasciata]